MRYWEGQKRASYHQKSNDLSTEHTDIILQSLKYDIVDIRETGVGLIENLEKIGTRVFNGNDEIKARITC